MYLYYVYHSLIHAVPVSVTTNPSNLTVRVGERATFVCAFSSSPAPSSIQWFKEGVSLPLTDERFNITPSSDGVSSVLSFVSVHEDHNTAYYCIAAQLLVGDRIHNATTDSATLTINCKLH